LIGSEALPQKSYKEITFDDLFRSRKFSSEYFAGFTPLNDGQSYIQVKKDSLNVYSFETGALLSTLVRSSELIPAGDTTPIPMGDYTLSDDETKILFSTESESIYRYSSKAEYYVFDTKTKKLERLSQGGKQQLATFSPDGGKVGFVRGNNLFVRDLESGEERQVTQDGKVNSIINGTTDWVYEEEFAIIQGFQWSPDGKNIAFLRFDESRVKEWELSYWGDLYPETYKFKYPKAGEDNSLVTMFIYNLDSRSMRQVDLGSETDQYIPRFQWTADPATLSIQRLNRLQNNLEILLADAGTGNSRVIYTEENKCYIEITDNLTFLKNGEQFIITSEKDGYNHIYLYDLKGNLVRQLTHGKYDVMDFYGVDEKKGVVYYTAAVSSPINRELFSARLDGKGQKKLSQKEGTNSAGFGKGYQYYVNYFSDANTPPYISVHRSDGQEVRMVKDNGKLRGVLGEYGISKKEFFSFTTGGGISLNGWMIKPPDFDSTKKYPVFMTVYGGPNSQTVLNSWGGGMWNQFLAQKGYIIASVDNRGTGARGEEFRKVTYRQLGKYETEDMIEGAKYLGSLPYVDPNRIGIWGWSYGGYMTALCLTKGADVFRMGIAVAPVTNWRYYDNIYTERYMRKPQENGPGYDDNSPVNHADKLKGKLLIIHGTADDNVHVQNTFDLVTALVAANKQFDMQLYPNSNHGIYTGKNTTYHLYQRMLGFITANL